MNDKDYIIITSSVVGLLAGLLAELTVLAARHRLDLWLRYAGYWSPGWLLTTAMSHWFGWYGLLSAIPAYLLIVLAFWLDSRKRFPR
jgi:hypothetical protein